MCLNKACNLAKGSKLSVLICYNEGSQEMLLFSTYFVSVINSNRINGFRLHVFWNTLYLVALIFYRTGNAILAKCTCVIAIKVSMQFDLI